MRGINNLLVSSESFEDLRNSIIGRLFYLQELYPVQESASKIYIQSAVLTEVHQNEQKDWIYFVKKNAHAEERIVKKTDVLLVIDLINHKKIINKISNVPPVYLFHDVVVLYDNKFWAASAEALVFVKEQ